MTRNAFLLLLAVVAATAIADVAHYRQVSATATSQTVPLGGVASVTIYNEGGNEIYFRLFGPGDAPADAVASATGGVYLAPGGTLAYSAGAYSSISIICSTGETATVHLYLP